MTKEDRARAEQIMEFLNITHIRDLPMKELSYGHLDTFWEIETGEYLSGAQVKELENQRDEMIKKLDLIKDQKNSDEVYETIINFCKKYEELCKIKYPEAPLPLEITKTLN